MYVGDWVKREMFRSIILCFRLGNLVFFQFGFHLSPSAEFIKSLDPLFSKAKKEQVVPFSLMLIIFYFYKLSIDATTRHYTN